MAANVIPNSWELIDLKLIVPLQYGKALPKSDRTSGIYPVFGSAGLTGKHDAALTTGPTILVGRKGAAGRVEFSAEPCWPIDTVYFSYGHPSIELKFYAHYLRFVNLGKLDQSTAIPSLSRDSYNLQQAPLPPLHEQLRIVAKVEELFSDLDAATAALKRVQANLKRYRASVLKSAVEGKLTAEWRAKNPPKETGAQLLERTLKERRAKWEENQLAKYKAQGKEPPKDWQKRYPEPATADTSALPKLPEGWVWATVDMVGDVQLGRQRSPKDHNGPNMRPYLRVANVFEDRIDVSDIMQMNFSPSEFNTFKLTDGDILLNEGQSLELIGRPAMYHDEVPNACFTNTLVRFRPSSYLDRHFAMAVFLAFYYAGTFQKIAKWTTNIAHLGADRFANLPFPLPPIAEQMQIASLTDEIKSSHHKQMTTLIESVRRGRTLRQAILKEAFDGKLVPQDPNDEPASELLKRIREERASAAANKPIKAEKKQRKPKTKSVGSVKKAKSTTSRKRA